MNHNFIIRLKRGYVAYTEEMERAEKRQHHHFLRFLKALTFNAFAEQVVTACAMYPRSYHASKDCLTDLSNGISNDLGIGTYRLTSEDYDDLAALVMRAGREVMESLCGIDYFRFDRRRSKTILQDEDDDYDTDVTATCDLRNLNRFTYHVRISEYNVADVNDDTYFGAVYTAIEHERRDH